MNEYLIDIMRLVGQGYCCAQIPIIMVQEIHNCQNIGLARALSALCRGFPNTSGPCGALLGGACLLGYFAGKGAPGQEEHERLPLMLEEYATWFHSYCADHHGGSNCNQIVKGDQPEPETCCEIMAMSYAKALEILVENGINPEEDPVGE